MARVSFGNEKNKVCRERKTIAAPRPVDSLVSTYKDCFLLQFSARTMHESYRRGRPVAMEVRSVAAGLAPPYAGRCRACAKR